MTPRDRRAVVWGGIAIVSAVLLLRGLPWGVGRFAAMRDFALDRQAALTRARAVLDTRESVRDSLARVISTIMTLAPKLVDGRTGAEAQASLSALVGLAASRHSLRVVRLDPLPDSAVGVFSGVSVQAELEGDAAGLGRLLRGIETAQPMLSVTSLGISSSDPAASGRPETLRIELSVAGYYLPRGEPSR